LGCEVWFWRAQVERRGVFCRLVVSLEGNTHVKSRSVLI